jgi:hypothetical protein
MNTTTNLQYQNRKLSLAPSLEELLDQAAADYRRAEEAGDTEAMRRITETYIGIRNGMLTEKIARGEVK